MNLNELTYVAALAADALYPDVTVPEDDWRRRRREAARHIRDGLLSLQDAGWTFTYTEPGEQAADTDAEHEAYVDACNERDMLRAQLAAVHEALRDPDATDARACENALRIIEPEAGQ